MEVKGFTFWRSYYDSARQLRSNKELQADYLMMILDYVFEEIKPEGDGVLSALFESVRPNLDRSKQKAASGSLGGIASKPKQTESKTKQAESKPKQAPSNKKKKKKEEIEKEEEGIPPLTPLSHPAAVQWAENVTMTNGEHDKLIAAYGPADTARLIEILDNYKGSTGKRYKNDYRAILSWVTDRLAEEKRKSGQKRIGQNAPQTKAQELDDFYNMAAEWAAEKDGGAL